MAGVDGPKGRRRNRFNGANRRREADVADRGHRSGWEDSGQPTTAARRQGAVAPTATLANCILEGVNLSRMDPETRRIGSMTCRSRSDIKAIA